MAMHVAGMPKGWTARVVILKKANGEIELYTPLLEYMRAHPFRSATWQNDVARVVGLFWDFCQIRGDEVMAAAIAGRTQNPHRALLRSFALALASGSDESTGLIWPKTGTRRVRTLVRALEGFAAWHQGELKEDRDEIVLSKHAPRDALSVTDLLIWSRLRNISMLKHIDAPRQIRSDSFVDLGPRTHGLAAEPVKFFPSSHLERLLWEGYLRPGAAKEDNPFLRFNLRDQMIALLDGWGGLRRSEGLHLWVQDVVEDPGKTGHALVVLNHPVEAKIRIPDPVRREVTLTRHEALERLYGLQPRNLVKRGRYHVGWKSLDLNKEHQAWVYWLDETAGALFWVLYLGYVRYVRRPIMKQRKLRGGYDHPFLFVSEGEDRGDDGPSMIGDPYSAKAYERNHEAAVLRIGLPHTKELGTTTHGLRHGFGQALSDLGVPAQVIKKGLHHRQFLSQVPYTVPTNERVNQILGAVSRGEPIPAAPLGHDSTRALLGLHEFITGGSIHA